MPPIAWKLPKVEPQPGTSVLDMWQGSKWTFIKGLGPALMNAKRDSEKQVLDDELAAYGFSVHRTPCASSINLKCHSMLLYEKNMP